MWVLMLPATYNLKIILDSMIKKSYYVTADSKKQIKG